MDRLDQRTCVPCRGGVPPLDAQERRAFKDASRIVTEAFRRVSDGEIQAAGARTPEMPPEQPPAASSTASNTCFPSSVARVAVADRLLTM